MFKSEIDLRIKACLITMVMVLGLLALLPQAALADTPVFDPFDGETDVPLNKTITVTFSEALADVDNDNVGNLITLKKVNAEGDDVNFFASIDDAKKVITITPQGNLASSQSYYLAVAAPGNESVSTTFTTSDFIFKPDTNTITGYTGSQSNVTIPEAIGDVNVEVIGESVFSGCSTLESINIGNKVTTIGKNAFKDCKNLTSLNIGGSVLTIADKAFWNCYNMKTLVIDDGVQSIGVNAFGACLSLTAINLPDSVTTIGNGAFRQCSALTSITMGPIVDSIGTGPFLYCDKLESIEVNADNTSYSSIDGVLFNKNQTLLIAFPQAKTGSYAVPDSVTGIDDTAFSHCSLTSITIGENVANIEKEPVVGTITFQYSGKLASIEVNADNTNYSSAGGVLYNKDKSALMYCPAAIPDLSFIIPDTVKTIEKGAFFDCKKLEQVTIPAGVETIKFCALNCPIPTIYLLGNAPTLENGAFSPNTSIYYFGDKTGFDDPSWSKYNIKAMVKPSITTKAVTAITAATASGSGNITDLGLPNPTAYGIVWNTTGNPTTADTKTDLGAAAATGPFTSSMTGLAPNAKYYVRAYATNYAGTAYGEQVSFSNATEADLITPQFDPGDGSFNISVNENITISFAEALTDIDEDNICCFITFKKNDAAGEDVTFTAGIDADKNQITIDPDEDLDYGQTYYICIARTLVSKAASITFSAIHNIGFDPDSQTIIYYEGSGNVVIPSQIDGVDVVTIGEQAFAGCSDLLKLTIPDTVTSIGAGAFNKCNSLTSITMGANMQSIGEKAFSGCSNLTTLKIGANVQNIGERAFLNCCGMTSIDVDVNNTFYSSNSGVLFDKGQTTLICYPPGRSNSSYSVPDGVETLSPDAFAICMNLQSVTVPASITSIGSYAFYSCENLTEIKMAAKVQIIDEGVFAYCSNLKKISISGTVEKLEAYAFQACNSLSEIYFYGNAPELGEDVFDEAGDFTVYYAAGKTGFNVEPWTDHDMTLMATAGIGDTIQVTTTTIITVPQGVAANINISPGNPMPAVEMNVGSAFGTIKITIPEGTVASGPDGWGGVFGLPTIKPGLSVTIGGAQTVDAVVKIGLDDQTISFSKAVRILVPGMAGKSVGYVKNGVFTPITLKLTADDQTTADNKVLANGEAVIDVGSDLVIWTKHFTEFVAYTPQSSNGSSSSNGGGGGGYVTSPSHLVTSLGGTISDQGAVIVILANTFIDDVRFTIKKAGGNGLTLPASGYLVSAVYEITRDKNNDFSQPITIKLPYDKTKYNKDEKVAVYWWNGSQWSILENIKVDETAGVVSGESKHLSKFAVIALKNAEAVAETTPSAPIIQAGPSDITGHWAEASILQLVNKGIISGYPDGNYKPDQIMTRAEFAVVLVKAFNLKDAAGKIFKDTQKHWAAGYISTAYAAGIIGGYSETEFGPDDPLTREQMAVMAVKAAGFQPAGTLSGMTDSGLVSPWARETVSAAISNQVISGYPDQSFRPQVRATRAEAFTTVVKAISKIH